MSRRLPLTTRLTTAAVCAVALPALLATAVPAAAAGNGRPLTTSLTGAAERPGPGDPTARARHGSGSTLAPGSSATTWR
jgi:hypothetical protein